MNILTKHYNQLGKIIYLAVLIGGMLWVAPAQAARSLSVTPVSGGNSIRFGRVDLPSTTNQEVRIRVISNEGTQYQVFQRISQAFQNERGESLDPDAIVVSAVIGSNSAGSVELQTVEQLSFAEQLIYTSTNNGLSDGLTLVYQVNPQQITRSGNFSGQIIYSLRPIGGGATEERILNAYLEVDGQLEVRQDTGSGTDIVRLRSDSDAHQEDYFRLSFAGNRGNQLRIYQEFTKFPADELNRDLTEDAVSMLATGGEQGELKLAQETALIRRRQLLYSSTAAADEIWIQFRLNDNPDKPQRAGRFTGRLSYVIESETVNQTLPVDLEIDIAPVFELTTEYPSGGMSFKRILPTGEPQLKDVLVTVNSNIGKPYLVTQDVRTALTNEKGEQFDQDFFTYKQETFKNSSGRVPQTEYGAVPEGESVLFYSDAFGSPAAFKVIYRLRPHQKMRPGDYKTSVRYTLEEK